MHRVDVRPALRNPASPQVLAPAARVVGEVQRTGQECHVHPGCPHRPAKLVDVHAELELLQAPAELVENHPNDAVVDVAQIAGKQLIGHPRPHGRSLKLLPHEVRVVVASLRRLGELHLLARQQFLHGAGLQTHHGGEAVAVHARRAAVNGINRRHVTRVRPGDEACEQVGDLLTEEHRVVEVVQRTQPQQYTREPGNAAQLPGLQRLENVQHFAGRNAHQLVVARGDHRVVSGVAAIHPVRHPLAQDVELNTSPDQVAVARHLVLLDGHELCGQQLQLQGDSQPVFLPPGPHPNEALAALLDHPRYQGLLAIEVGALVGVRLVSPVHPQFQQQAAQCLVLRCWHRNDARADEVAHPGVDGTAGVGVVARRSAGALAQQRQRRDR
ncbi:hypothetical protein FQZ97_711240 [compost metagenome]